MPGLVTRSATANERPTSTTWPLISTSRPGLPITAVNSRCAASMRVPPAVPRASMVPPAVPAARARNGTVNVCVVPGANDAAAGVTAKAGVATSPGPMTTVGVTPVTVAGPSLATTTFSEAVSPTFTLAGSVGASVIVIDGRSVAVAVAVAPSVSITVSVTVRDDASPVQVLMGFGPAARRTSPSPKFQS